MYQQSKNALPAVCVCSNSRPLGTALLLSRRLHLQLFVVWSSLLAGALFLTVMLPPLNTIGESRANFVCGKAEEVLPSVIADERGKVIAVADPPRCGLRKLFNWLLNFEIRSLT